MVLINLFLTKKTLFIFLIPSKFLANCSYCLMGSCSSINTMTSAFLAQSIVFPTPIFSILSSVFLIPAVSINLIRFPPIVIVSSNTSSIPIKILSEHLTDNEKKDFCITHFFNPVRYMGLLEIVKNENNDLKKIDSLKKFCENELGKGAIVCNDTPGFLGNRIGVYAMQVAMTEAFKMKLSIEEADAVFGRPMGIPKTGVFGLYDLIGIDLMADVLKSFIKELPEQDPFQEVAKEIPLVKKLIETGYTGRKGKGGFYRMNKANNQKILEAINLDSGDYSPSKKIDMGIDTVNLKELINRKDKYGEYSWSVISKIIKYASSLVPGITDKFNDIDEAMRLGFNWAMGPFEMLKSIGVNEFFNRIDDFKNNAFLQNLSKTKDENFYGSRQLYTDIETLGKVKPKAIKTDKNKSAEIYRFKDFNIVEFTTKACALDYDSMDALKKATDKPLIVINESMQFSAGVNLSYTMNFAEKNDFNYSPNVLLRGLDSLNIEFDKS